jgi:mono/diheme cytochrome c family protein
MAPRACRICNLLPPSGFKLLMKVLHSFATKGACFRGALLCAGVTALAGIGVFVLAALAVILSGAYNVAATDQHGALAAWILHTTALDSIRARSGGIVVPDLSDQAQIGRGLQLFRSHCAQCHGAPGEPPDDFAKGLLPVPPPLMQVGREWRSKEIYWTIVHGVKMTAMPAWEFRITPRDAWDIVAFVQLLPKLSPAAYEAMKAKAGEPKVVATDEPVNPLLVPDAARGKTALAQYACDSCHDIPGIPGPVALVGPPLSGVGSRLIIAGLLANTPQNMRDWILHPQKIKPGDAMPNMGVSERDAEDMVTYLESLH